MSVNSLPRVGFMTRTTVVPLQLSLDTLDTVLRVFYAKLSLGFNNPLPLSEESFIDYCKSIVSYKTAIANQNRSDDVLNVPQDVKTALRSAVLPCFLESFVSRIGDWYDVETGVHIIWEYTPYNCLSGDQLALLSLKLAAVRSQNVDLAFDAVSLKPVSDLDNSYILDSDVVYGLSGTDVKGYQMAAVLQVTPVHFEHEMLFRKQLCTSVFAKQEVVNGFGQAIR